MVQLLAPYIDHESHNSQLTVSQTDVTLMPIADHTVQQYDRLKIRKKKTFTILFIIIVLMRINCFVICCCLIALCYFNHFVCI